MEIDEFGNEQQKAGVYLTHRAMALAAGAGLFFIMFGALISSSMSGLSTLQSGDAATCDAPMYSKTTLKTAYENSFAAMFKDTKGEKKFEASDVIIVDNNFYTVCDNSWSIEKITESLTPFSVENVQIGDPNRDPNEDSGFEAIFHDAADDTFYVVRESVALAVDHKGNEGNYHAVVQEIKIRTDGDYNVINECVSEIEFDGSSKGLEGAVGLKSKDGELYMLGLCEGNHCLEGKEGKDKGNGVAVLMKKEVDVSDPIEGYTCVWKTQRQLSIPSQAFFQDYSAISINAQGRVAITSQEEAQVWVGYLSHIDPEDGSFDPEKSEFSVDDAVVYDFPRSDADCHLIYCNVEGIHWINDEMLVGVSDKMKKGGKQDYRCLQKDQSIHVFVLP